MTVKTQAVTVTTAATAISTAPTDNVSGASVCFYNNGAVTIFAGGSDVTSANGVPVPAGTWSPGFDLQPGESLYGRTASSTAEARVIETGV